MSNYEISAKPAFTVLGLGTILTGDYRQIPAQKQTFWQQVTTDGRYQALQQQAQNALQFAVNEAVDGVMHFYAGVQTAADVTTDSADERAIQFPASDYLVVTDSADTALDLFNQLEGAAFGQILPSLTDQAYVGGPNTSVITATTATEVKGELWVPLSAK